ncbi:hypothetical protein FRC10_011129 [Ceratobasidium sp. 414]|nr:hypothetical protein FRC10_011129 [Ceratobasidium sp. 414]
MAFDAQALWDLSGPTTLPSMSDNDFLQLLEKQMQAAHPTTGLSPVNDTQSLFSPAGLVVSPAAVMGSAPAPMDSATPPLTDESSPSPPASVQENNTVGDGTKRKAGRERSRDGQPRAKVQHKASDEGVNSQPQDDAAKKGPARRKSSGTTVSDENRLAKRKEQNRAAQRAFRDRKEKHVKDLEDKIHELEQKFSTSESENTNLKDLLKRLQNENMMLKQSAFTFEFAPKDNQTSPNNTASSLSSANTNPFTSPAQSSKSSASPESTASPYIANSPQNSLFKQTPPPPTPSHLDQDKVSINAAGFAVFAPPASIQPTPATPALAMSSPGAGPSTINHNAFNHNSLFTSYRDPMAYSFGVPLGDFNTLNTANIGAEFGMDFSMDMSLGSTDLGAFGLGSDFDDLFGGQLGALDGTSSYGGVSGVTSPVMSISTPQTAVAPTPIPKPMIIDGLPSMGESARVECSIKAPTADDWRRCPKTREEFIDLVKQDATQPKSTFGPPLDSSDKARVEREWEQWTVANRLKEPDMDHLCTELFDKAQCTELKTRMKASMMRIAKDMANGPPA